MTMFVNLDIQKGAVMELSRRARIALNLMVELATRTDKRPLVLASAAVRLGSSPSHLESIAHRLRSRGLIDATRGPGGGYKLGRQASQITVLEVILAADNSARVLEHLLNQKLEGAESDSLTQTLLEDIEDEASTFLRKVTIESLATPPTQAKPAEALGNDEEYWPGRWFNRSEESLTEAMI